MRLCLQVDAHIEDFVDAYVGPAAIREAAAAEGPVDPHRLHDETLALLEDTPGTDLAEDRVAWLLAQLRGLECVTARLGGEEVSWSEEVERCLGIRPEPTDEAEFRESHARLDAALPGSGDLAGRYQAWLNETNVPREMTHRALQALGSALRRRTARIVALPDGEGVDYETVAGVPWQAYNMYLGNLRSRIQVAEDLPRSLIAVVDVVAHEVYPGHHTEMACKEHLLYREDRRLETTVKVVAAPEVVITEGLAVNALAEAVREDGLRGLLDEAGDLGVRMDPEVAEVVHEEEWNLFAAGTNAARMLHEDGISTGDAEAYLLEWTLETPERVAKTVRFLTDPGIRTYSPAYTHGRRLCRAFIDRTPDGFRRLLTEQLTVSSLLDPA